MKRDEIKYKVMFEMSRHIGRSKAISMSELSRKIFGADNETNKRILRKVIEEIRKKDALAICSTRSKHANGYYLAAAGKELEDYCNKIRKEALRKLMMESKLRNITLKQLLGQMELLV